MNKVTLKNGYGVIMLTVAMILAPSVVKAIEPCPLPNDNNALLDLLWPMFDTNKDGGLSLSELSQIYPISRQYFNMVDTNQDGKVDRNELQPLLALLQLYVPGGLLSLVDTNANQLIEYPEVSGYISQEDFRLLDRNKNGVIDCGDVGELPPLEGETEEGEIGIEGEILPPDDDPLEGETEEGEIGIEGEILPPAVDPCYWIDYVIGEFANLDQNGDGVLTRDEFGWPTIAIYPPIVDFDGLFEQLDKNDNGIIEKEDLSMWLEECYIDDFEDEPCSLPPLPISTLLEMLFPIVDENADGKLTPDELRALYSDIDSLLSQYNLTLEQIYLIVDSNRDGGVSIDEILPILNLLAPQWGVDPNNILSIIDTNGDSLIHYEEVAEYVTPEQFAYVDIDGNGSIDCNDLNAIEDIWEGELPPWEGEVSIPEIDPCIIGPLAIEYFDLLDQNKDGKITKDELITPLTVIYPIPIDPASLDAIFALFDLNSDDAITREEIETLIADCSEIPPIEGEPLPIEGEFEIPTDPCIIAPLALEHFDLLDRNGDGMITIDELSGPVIMTIAPLPIDISIISEVFKKFDLNADGAVTKEEIQAIIDNCLPEPEEGEPSEEGEIIILPDLWNPCSLAHYVIQMFSVIDLNNDGVIDVNEAITYISSIYMMPIDQTWFTRIISMLDIDGDGTLPLEEVTAIIDKCNMLSDETGGQGPGQGEGNEPPSTLILERAVSGNRRYWPSQTLTVILTIRNPIRANVSALGLKETLPAGWVLQSVVESSNAVVVPSSGATGTLEFAWMDIPLFPVKVVYNVAIPNDADGPAVFSGYVLYRTASSDELTSPVVETVLIKGWSPDRSHSTDSNQDWSISLSEILRIIQMFNFGGYGCDENSEDGYSPGEGKHRNCIPHAGDYLIQDWKFNLSELLRQIQLYNAPGKGYIIQEGTEDGFAPLLN